MEYAFDSETGRMNLSRYSVYLESIRSGLPEHVYAFASDSAYFYSALHDAWIETITVREIASGKRNQIRQLEIQICLLGPHHDRRIHLNYTGVTQYSFVTPPKYVEPRYKHTAHGDLLAHEIRLGHDGLLLHEILFERGSSILIECSDIRHTEEMLEQQH